MQKYNNILIKNEWLLRRYTYRNDPLKGAFDWNPKFALTFACLDFKDDCDGFATLVKLMFKKKVVKRYAILPYDLRRARRMHIVAACHQSVYSSGKIYLNTTLEEYLQKEYKNIDCLVLRYF